jgi:hypothetical protein
MTYQVKNRFQILPFKFNLQRYTAEFSTQTRGGSRLTVVGLSNLNPV